MLQLLEKEQITLKNSSTAINNNEYCIVGVAYGFLQVLKHWYKDNNTTIIKV